MTEDELVDALVALDPLSELPRTGWILSGVASPESVAAHTHGVALAAMFLVDALREEGMTLDGERVLRMALVHDAPEARTGDIPMPNKTPALREALREVEAGIVRDLLPASSFSLWEESEAGESLEARVVKAADKIQMMVKMLVYQTSGRGRLDEFWENAGNFNDGGLALARRVHARIAARAGRSLPPARAQRSYR